MALKLTETGQLVLEECDIHRPPCLMRRASLTEEEYLYGAFAAVFNIKGRDVTKRPRKLPCRRRSRRRHHFSPYVPYCHYTLLSPATPVVAFLLPSYHCTVPRLPCSHCRMSPPSSFSLFLIAETVYWCYLTKSRKMAAAGTAFL